MGPGHETSQAQIKAVNDLGGLGIAADGTVPPEILTDLHILAGVIWWGDADTGRMIEQALTKRQGPITALITARPDVAYVLHERPVCIDTTAAGGNAALLAEVGNA
jgi:RHH-type proline utilization regulon transcriptional repressor/proline dehydrogenase/delta 1-pyrroline-5-carboxylate dehydrogenase